MDLVFHNANNNPIGQRARDGYVNATALCKAAGKKWNDYFRLASTSEYLEALSSKLGLKIIFKGVATNPATEEENPATTLIQVFQGGSLQSTWIHPQVAIHLAMWLNPDFAVLVTEWVVTWMSAGINPTQPQPHSQQPQPEQPKKLPWKPLELFPAMSEETFKSLDAISRQHFTETSAERAIRIQKERTEEMLWCNQYQYKQYFPK